MTPELITLMEMALMYGYNEDDIARQIIVKSRSWSGRESGMWDGEISQYDLLLNHKNPQINKIGQICLDYARGKKKQAENEEYYEDVFGR